MEKNQEFTGEVIALGSNGEGIIKHGGVTYFVPYCLEGETVRVKVLKVKGNIGYGKVEEIITPSLHRVEPVCEAFKKCGGCQLQHLSYEKQLEFKKKSVADCLKKIGGLDVEVEDTVPCDEMFGYRNKLQLPVGVDKDGKNVIGFYAERSHRIVPVSDCKIHPEWAKKVIKALSSYMRESGVNGYDELKKTGEIRHIVVRELDKKFIVTLVVTTEKIRDIQRFIIKLSTVFEEFTLVLNVNKKDTNVVFGDKFIPVKGNGFFEAEEFGVKYEAGSETFVQVNGNVRKKLYERAIYEVAGERDEVVFDCYSGGGLLSAMAAKNCKRVYGIEIVEEASRCADALAKRNNLQNKMINVCGDVAEKLPTLMEKERGEKIKLILDPPRAGIARSVLDAIIKAEIPKLVLISCNPSTLARDLGILTGSLKENERGELIKSEADGAYKIEKIIPFDMFSMTKHVETIAILSRERTNGQMETKA